MYDIDVTQSLFAKVAPDGVCCLFQVNRFPVYREFLSRWRCRGRILLPMICLMTHDPLEGLMLTWISYRMGGCRESIGEGMLLAVRWMGLAGDGRIVERLGGVFFFFCLSLLSSCTVYESCWNSLGLDIVDGLDVFGGWR